MTVPRIALGDRSLFPDLAPRAYLAHAALTPPSILVRRAVVETLDRYAAMGVGAGIEMRRSLEGVREKAARLIGADAHEIAFVESTTEGVVSIARSIRFRPGERIVLFEGEFPANVTPWQLVARDLGLEVVFVPCAAFERSDEEGLAALDVALRDGARLVAVSAVQFQSGLRMPLERIAAACRARGAELFVDAIQALGVVPFDVRTIDADYVVAGGHKFLMGLEGAGIAYVRARALASLGDGLAGWTSHEEPFRFLVEGAGHLRYDRPLVRSTQLLERGALSMVGIAALSASLDVLLSLGVDAIFAHVTRYLDALEPELVALGFASVRAAEASRRSATLSLRIDDARELHRLFRSLAADGVITSTPDGHLRFAPHFANALDEVPTVIEAVRAATR